jgi:hypothetical protein
MLYMCHSGVWVHPFLMPLQGCTIVRGGSSGGSCGLPPLSPSGSIHPNHVAWVLSRLPRYSSSAGCNPASR